MHIHRGRFTLPLLIAFLIAGWSPSREAVRPASTDDIVSKRYYIIDELLYFRLGLRSDTLLAKAVRRPSSDGSGGMVHMLGYEAAAEGLDMGETIYLTLLENPRIKEKGDTLLIPMRSIDVVAMRETNPYFVAGAAAGTPVGVGVIVLIILAAGAFVGLLAAFASVLKRPGLNK
jgi:hypothetical protein